MPDHPLLLDQIAREAATLAVDWHLNGLGQDGFAVTRFGQRWTVQAGNARSALWAVRHLRQGGGEGDFRPRFAVRGLNLCESLARHEPDQIDRLIDRMADWRMNRLVIHPQYGWKEHGRRVERACAARGIEIVHYIYTTIAFTPEAGPELLAKDESGKPRTARVECYTRLCPSSAEARRLFREGARRYFASDRLGDGQRLVLQTADGLELCACPDCRGLSAIEQWQPLLEIAVDEAHRANRGLQVEFISYIHRFQPPKDLRVFDRIDAVMFDLHFRYRFAALDQPHPEHITSKFEAPADPRVLQMPINRYLLDRLCEWRAKFPRTLYVFENLMLQGTLSSPQPNTAALLRDLDVFQQQRIDGVIYEAFEPGIASFARQLTCLSRHLWNDSPAPELEAGLQWIPDPQTLKLDILPVPLDYPAELELAAAGPDAADPALREYLSLLRPCLEQPSWTAWNRLVAFFAAHPRRFDDLYIPFVLAKRAQKNQPRHVDDPLAREFLETTKIWDFMERRPEPRQAARDAIARLVRLTSQTN